MPAGEKLCSPIWNNFVVLDKLELTNLSVR